MSRKRRGRGGSASGRRERVVDTTLPKTSSPEPTTKRLAADSRSFAILTLIASAILAAILSVMLAPIQESRGQQGAEARKDEKLSDQPPLKVHAESISDGGISYSWAFEKPLSDAQIRQIENTPFEPTENADFTEKTTLSKLIRSAGGKRLFITGEEEGGGFGNIHKLTFTGNRRLQVEIFNIEIRIVERHPAPEGSLLYSPLQGGAEIPELLYELTEGDLIQPFSRKDGKKINYFNSNVYTLAEGEVGAFKITSFGQCRCSWEFIVHSRSGGKPLPVMVIRADGTSNGPLFETVGAPDPPEYKSYMTLMFGDRESRFTRSDNPLELE
ncbi:hypothetical protein ACFQ08_00645 [Streptosporangium algeriense]|uniref:Uncharacterized protein n=1 Tax=Streptosporangium algeriense TaxID=1682748 RepID=A0ABW3DJF3_9ACTN